MVNPRQAVIDYAMAQIGKPYVWAAAGPDSFDCSGLTMQAYKAAGVTIQHFTVAQYTQLSHVPLAQAQPGDLLFFGGVAPHHVGIYLSPNRMIDAPTEGIPVGVHDYTTYGDVDSVVGVFPGGGTASMTQPVPAGAPFAKGALKAPFKTGQKDKVLAYLKQEWAVSAGGSNSTGGLTSPTFSQFSAGSDQSIINEYETVIAGDNVQRGDAGVVSGDLISVATGADATGWASQLGKILSWLGDIHNWERIGLYVLGAVILLIAAVMLLKGQAASTVKAALPI